MKRILTLLFLMAFGFYAKAQTTISTATGTTGYTGVNGVTGNSAITFVVENTNAYSIVLDALELSRPAVTPAAPVTLSLWYSATSISDKDTINTNDWTQITSVTLATLGTGYINIFSGINFIVPANTTYRFAVMSNNGIPYSGATVGACTPSILSADGVNLQLGDAQINGAYVGWGGATTVALPNGPRWFTGSITFYPNLPCTSPPTAGVATASVSTICPNAQFTLDLTGSAIGTGISYQWQDSANGGSWNNIAGAITKKYIATQTGSKCYRCKVTCSGNTSTSASVCVTSPALISGTFTINNGSPTGGTNFQSFGAAINYLNCGINGPVTFNVVAGSGPYDEQVIIPSIKGLSATNTLTINGNGNTLSYNSATTTTRTVMVLNGADHVTIDSLNIDASAGTFGWCMVLTNKADSNVIKRCTFTTNTTAATTNYYGLLINGSATATASSGDNGSYNTIMNNTFVGGYSPIYLYGNSTAGSTTNAGNVIKDNIVKDAYSYSIIALYQPSGLVISNNDISRPTRTNSTTTAGVFLSTGCVGALVDKNKIHNMFDGFLTGTSVCYAIYVAGKGKPGKENKIINNILYNANGNGTYYGLYNTGGDSMLAYHNTFVMDDAATTTGAAYGFYQTGVASGVDFRNNLVYITRSGTGIKRVFQFVTVANIIKCNNNGFYFAPTGGTNNNFGQVGTPTYTTLSAWSAATGYDALSAEVDPAFISASTGDLHPSVAAINDIGANLGVATDITGVARTTTPDPGAFEFTPPACTTPPTAGSVSVATTSICANTQFGLSLIGNSVGNLQTYRWERSLNGTTGWDSLAPRSTNSNLLTSQSSSYYYRCVVTCSGISATTPTQLISSPSLVSGSYTINSAATTGGTNFQSFADAINYFACGINGPLTLNVVANSGPYTERIILPTIFGTSSTNTITINGNGNTILYNAPDLNNKTAITLNGTDHVIIDSLNVDISGGATAGWGIVLMNQADSNVIKRCQIINNTASTSTNYSGILINGSNTTTATSGNNGNYNTIINNTIIGGYYGVYLYGFSTLNTTQNIGNKIMDNKIQDFYLYAVYGIYQSSGLIVRNNNISRSNRTAVGTAYGIFLGTNSVSALIEKNRVHNLFDMATNNTSATYGVYVSADAKPGTENRVINNSVFNINSNGPAYGIYNAGGDSMWAFHNTIVLDDQGTSTGTTYGLYQTTAANGVLFQNNIVYVTRGGTGIKRCVAFATNTSKIKSTNNVLYLNATSGTNNNIGQFGTTNYATLTDWQNGTGFDTLSQSYDPVFTNPNVDDYIPTNVNLNGIGANLGVTEDINGLPRSITPDPGAHEITISGCTNPPTPGVATASVSIACPNISFTLNLTGNSAGTGQTYKWQKQSGANWIDISTAQTITSYSLSQTVSATYRCAVTCNAGTTVYSSTVMVTTPSGMSGTYTINNTVPTSGTTFQTFGEAINGMVCGGVTGAVTLNAVVGTGPYNERITIPQINGITSANKLIIKGNGVTMTYNTNDANARTAITLDGADNVVIDSLNIDVAAGTYGWGILLTNAADSNLITNCTITTNATAITTNYAGIIMSGSISSANATGNNGSNNTFTKNTINGGYYGIDLYGSTTNNTQNKNNIISNNTFNDFYQYAVYASYIPAGLIVSANNITRTTRNTASATGAGVYLTTGCVGSLVEKNTIHNVFDGFTTASTAGFYGMYIAADGKPGAENKLLNNLVYNINSNGAIYGLYNVGADSMQAYHNTFVLDDATATAGATYGLYQTGLANGVDFRNNIIFVNRGGTGIKRAIYLATTTSTIICNRNGYYFNPSAGTNNNLGQYGTTNYATFANWQTANSSAFDQNSYYGNPMFTTTILGDLKPSAQSLDNIGAALNVGTDILGVARSATSPDAGAIEFTGTVPVKLINFTGVRKNNVNELNWTTTNEINNAGFEVQRSNNAIEFTKIGFIAPAGNGGTSVINNYGFNDKKALQGANYYRLMQIDNNGKAIYSKVVVINTTKANRFELLSINPNPVTTRVVVNMNAVKDEAIQIVITDVAGKVILKQVATVTEGNNNISLNVESLTSGTYLVKAICNNACESGVLKMVKH